MITYTYKNKTYEILGERKKQLYIDFIHCEKIGDYLTIKNRIKNGTMWGWLKEIK